jgi:endoglucanase
MSLFLRQLLEANRRLLRAAVSVIFFLAATARLIPQSGGYWHTRGSEILDENDQPQHITGINWYGFETTDLVPHGLTQQDYRTILHSIHDMGFNVVRIPLSNQMVESPIVPTKISYATKQGTINSDLRNLNSLQILDKIVDAAGKTGLHIILDNHRSAAGNGPEASGLWYTDQYPESKWIADWQMLVRRYKGKTTSAGGPIIIGVDLRNEPHSVNGRGACWSGDPAREGCPFSDAANNWTAAAIRAGNAVLAEDPNLLIFVEGTDCYAGDCTFWGSNLQGIRSSKVVLTQANRVVYSAHDYGPVEYRHRWFNSETTTESLVTTWIHYWAFVVRDDVAPVWIGEFGTTDKESDTADSAPGSQGQWFSSLLRFLPAYHSIHWTYWAINGEDRYGLLGRDYTYSPDRASPRMESLVHLMDQTRSGLNVSAR